MLLASTRKRRRGESKSIDAANSEDAALREPVLSNSNILNLSIDWVREGPPVPNFLAQAHQKVRYLGCRLSRCSHAQPWQIAIADVGVTGGSWVYYATFNPSLQVSFGWCSQSYDPYEEYNMDGACWMLSVDTGRCALTSEKSSEGLLFEVSASEMTVGVHLDCVTKQVQFYTGETIIGCFSRVSCPQRMFPVCVVSSTDVQFEWEAAHAPRPAGCACRSLVDHSTLAQKQALLELFQYYVAQGPHSNNTALCGSSLDRFMHDVTLSTELENMQDAVFLVLAWRLQLSKFLSIGCEEWMNGFFFHGCFDMHAIQRAVRGWWDDAARKDSYSRFYAFVYEYMGDGRRSIDIDTACVLWGILSVFRPWPLLPRWCNFLKAKGQRFVSKDVWQTMRSFSDFHNDSLGAYNQNGAWPCLFDEFYQFDQNTTMES